VTTPSQTVGPFYSIGLCRRADNVLVADGVRVSGTLFDGAGEPIPDGLIEVWSATARAWGRCGTHLDGRFEFVLPKAPHYEVYVFARGLLRHQLTRLYFPDQPEDPVLAALTPDERATLVAQPDGDGLRFDIRMQGDSQTVFFAT
jgi:protocatechuate 3,4-dioxygenase, alpha subunit